MLASFSLHRRVWLSGLFLVLLLSVSTTWASENTLSDGISMGVTALMLMSLGLLLILWLFDAVHDICNP
jgi:hypothetical protein